MGSFPWGVLTHITKHVRNYLECIRKEQRETRRRRSMGLMKRSRSNSYIYIYMDLALPSGLSSCQPPPVPGSLGRVLLPERASSCRLLCLLLPLLRTSFLQLFPYLAPHLSNLSSPSSEMLSPNTLFLIITSICSSPVYLLTCLLWFP